MQTNYPLHDMGYSKFSPTTSLSPPSYTPRSFALQPPNDSWFYYYEITILSNPNNKTKIAIGLTTKPYPTFRLPGCNSHSVGYHSDEGRKLHNEGLTVMM